MYLRVCLSLGEIVHDLHMIHIAKIQHFVISAADTMMPHNMFVRRSLYPLCPFKSPTNVTFAYVLITINIVLPFLSFSSSVWPCCGAYNNYTGGNNWYCLQTCYRVVCICNHEYWKWTSVVGELPAKQDLPTVEWSLTEHWHTVSTWLRSEARSLHELSWFAVLLHQLGR